MNFRREKDSMDNRMILNANLITKNGTNDILVNTD